MHWLPCNLKEKLKDKIGYVGDGDESVESSDEDLIDKKKKWKK